MKRNKAGKRELMKEKSIRRSQCLILCIFLWISFLFSACVMDMPDCFDRNMQETQSSQYSDDIFPDMYPVYFLTENTIQHRFVVGLRDGNPNRAIRVFSWISCSVLPFIFRFFCITNSKDIFHDTERRIICYIHDKDGMK